MLRLSTINGGEMMIISISEWKSLSSIQKLDKLLRAYEKNEKRWESRAER